MSRRASLVPVLLGILGGCSEVTVSGGLGDEPLPPGTLVPLTDMNNRTYRGFAGGLYPERNNAAPTEHDSRGRAAAALVRPRARSGTPAANGRIVMVSIGMSNTTQEFTSFMQLALSDPMVNSPPVHFIDGAAGGRTAEVWRSPTSTDYDRVRDTRLVPAGLTEAQVQIAWVKVANPGPQVALPATNSDAFLLLRQMGDIMRALKVRYPNLRLAFVSSRIFAGYATTALNPEPYAFESGLAVKWLVQAQIDQMRTGSVDVRAGDLDSRTAAPWIGWGPYLWADGTTARSDGLTWLATDFAADGTHPSSTGQNKVATRLLDFLKTSMYSRCWFVAGQTC